MANLNLSLEILLLVTLSYRIWSKPDSVFVQEDLCDLSYSTADSPINKSHRVKKNRSFEFRLGEMITPSQTYFSRPNYC